MPDRRPRQVRQRRRRTIAIGVLAAAGTGIGLGVSAATAQGPIAYPTAVVSVSSVNRTLDVSGVLQPVTDAAADFQISGNGRFGQRDQGPEGHRRQDDRHPRPDLSAGHRHRGPGHPELRRGQAARGRAGRVLLLDLDRGFLHPDRFSPGGHDRRRHPARVRRPVHADQRVDPERDRPRRFRVERRLGQPGSAGGRHRSTYGRHRPRDGRG